MDEKTSLPPYTAQAPHQPLNSSQPQPPARHIIHGRRFARRSRAIKVFALACLGFIVLAQWGQLWRAQSSAPMLSVQKLSDDLQTCKKLRHKPQDPQGAGREKNARYLDGGKPTLIKNATIWVGEPVKGTSAKDAHAGKGWEWTRGDVLLQYGLIQKVEAEISSSSVPDDTITYQAHGRPLTAGIIDMHSHVGVYPLPALQGSDDGNEMSDNITPWARSIDAILPFDVQFQVIKSGGVTTSLVLPGSGNNMGGEAYLVKHAVGKPDGRKELSARDLLADPEQNWRYMKMACGENAKRVHSDQVFSRMGESYSFRHAFEQASELVQKQNDWCDKAEALGVESMQEYLPQQIAWESLGAALRGQVHINTHCYTVPDLEAMVDHTNEFKFPVRAFHHAHQTFLVPEILKRTWGGRAPSSAIFADNMYYKTESYIGSEHAGKYLYDEGLTPVYVSDNPVLNAQHVLFEAAKGYKYGLPYHAALASVTTAPAEDLGMGQRMGKVKSGFDADVVVWDSDPLSVGAAPVQVWIDGTSQFDDPVELSKPYAEPIVPDESLGVFVEEPTEMTDVVFEGLTKIFLANGTNLEAWDEGYSFNVAISKGEISCLGLCKDELEAAETSGKGPIRLKNGYLTRSFVAAAGTLGLSHIDAESATNNGANYDTFSRAIDGLSLDGKKLRAGYEYGATRAISAPIFTSGGSHYGTSVGFVTTAQHALKEAAIFESDVAVHYTLDLGVRAVGLSYSAAFGGLRAKLLTAAAAKTPAVSSFSEAAALKKVVEGKMVLALTINSADGIATALRIKSEVESELSSNNDKAPKLRIAIIGGAEAHILAKELAEANVGVIVSPAQSTGDTWDARRTLSGAPLTNGTTLDQLLAAGVTTAIGLKEDWMVRDLGLAAGIAYHNGEGRVSEAAALDLVSTNVYKILGGEVENDTHFVVHEGSPLDIGSRIKAVGSGNGKVAVFV
ncbi:carbohydrate esterase family 9 protein [Sarocladium strictum]